MSHLSPEQRASGWVGGVLIAGWIVGVAAFLGGLVFAILVEPIAAAVSLLAAGMTFGLLANALLRH